MKEIIIDGVDVAGCRYILDDATCYYEFNNDYEPTPCRLDPKCQYKQLKRLEQENAELKQENAELKADLKSLEYTVALQGKRDIDNATDLFAKHIAKIESENSILKAEKAKYYQQTLDDEIQINELLQTLQEIKKHCK